MKKLILILLALVLTVGAAQADDLNELLRERKLIVGGVEETVTESKYISMNGFSLWVDADHFWPTNAFGGVTDEFVDTASAAGTAETTVSVLMVASQVPVEQADTFIGEAVAPYPAEAVSELEHVILPTGLEYYVQQAVEEEICYRFYVVKGTEYLVCVTAGFPEAVAEEYVTRIDALVNSMEFVTE